MDTSFLKDSTFLLKVNQHKVRKTYASLSILDFETENLVAKFQGKVISGNMSITANSSTRRTGSLSVMFDEDTYNITDINNLIAVDKKLMIAIGLENPYYNTQEYKKYGDILWFPQGVFIITNASSSYNSNGCGVSLNFIDKSGFLNGICGGTLVASTNFHESVIVDADGNETTNYPLIYDIIKQAVHHFGNQSFSRIIVNNVDLVGRQVATWTGITPICFATLPDGTPINNGSFIISGEDYPDYQDKYYKDDVVGYLETDLTYPGELIGAAGETVGSILDKIKSTLGNYEWFYDTDGNFRFQQIPNFLGTGSTPLNLTDQEDEILTSLYSPVYSDVTHLSEFADKSLVVSVSSSPNFANIKNDFVMWGVQDDDHLVRYHLAIDERPKPNADALCYKQIWSIEEAEATEAGNHLLLRYGIRNSTVLNPGEQWRECVAPNLRNVFTQTEYQFNWREELYRKALLAFGSSTHGSYYDEELMAEWRLLYDPLSTRSRDFEKSFQAEWQDSIGTPWYGYTKDVITNPSALRYWLDLIDNNAEASKYSVARIGRRSVVEQNSTVSAVYNNQINDIVFVKNVYDHNDIISQNLFFEKIKHYRNIGQVFALVRPDQWDQFGVKSYISNCYELARESLYNNLIYNTGVSLSCIPLYYLDVNQVLKLNFPDIGVQGNYVISSISWSIGSKDTMSLSLHEAIVMA